MRDTLQQIKQIETRSSRLTGLMQAAINLLRYESECGCEPDFEALQAVFDVLHEEVGQLSELSTEAATMFEALVNAAGGIFTGRGDFGGGILQTSKDNDGG